MKLNKDYMMRNIVGETVLVPTGDASNQLSGMITLNEVAAFIFEKLQEGKNEEEIIKAVLDEFEIDEETAKRDVNGFIDALRQYNIVLD